MASHTPQERACLMISPEMTDSFTAGKRTRARACMLDAVFDVHSHPHLVSTNNDETAVSQAYVTRIFDGCASYIARTMKGLDLISLSLPTDHSSLPNKNAVPVTAILHGSHEICLQTVQAMKDCGRHGRLSILDLAPSTRPLEDSDVPAAAHGAAAWRAPPPARQGRANAERGRHAACSSRAIAAFRRQHTRHTVRPLGAALCRRCLESDCRMRTACGVLVTRESDASSDMS